MRKLSAILLVFFFGFLVANATTITLNPSSFYTTDACNVLVSLSGYDVGNHWISFGLFDKTDNLVAIDGNQTYDYFPKTLCAPQGGSGTNPMDEIANAIDETGQYKLVVSTNIYFNISVGCSIGESFTSCWNKITSVQHNSYGYTILSAAIPTMFTVATSTATNILANVTSTLADTGFLAVLAVAAAIPLVFYVARGLIGLISSRGRGRR